MNRKAILTSVLTLALAGNLLSAAWAEIFQRTVILSPGAGNVTIEDLGVGDTLALTLVNPTNQPLMFETTQPLGAVGQETSWTVPPNSSITVDLTYTRPFDDDVEFVVRGTQPGAPVIARGVMIPAGQGVQERPAAFQPVAQPTMIRGFW